MKEKSNSFVFNFKNISSDIYILIIGLLPTTFFYIARVLKYRLNNVNYNILLENELSISIIVILSILIYYFIFVLLKHSSIKCIANNIRDKIFYIFVKILMLVINYVLLCIILEIKIINILSIVEYIIYSLFIKSIFHIIIKEIKKGQTNMTSELIILIILLVITLPITTIFNTKNLNNSLVYFVEQEGREMIVFDKDNEKAIICDYNIENDKIEYKCENNNLLIDLNDVKIYQK